MSQLGQVKKTLPFRAMSKQCKFTTLQGMSTTHQDNPSNTSEHHKRPETPSKYNPIPPKHSQGTIHAQFEVNTNKQTLPDIPRPSQALFEDG